MTRLTLLFTSSLTVMAAAAISPALPTIAEHFQGGAPGGGGADFLSRLLLTAPAISIALTAMALGWVLDRYGRLRPLYVAAVLYAVAGTAGLWADDLTTLVISRVVLGLAVAVLITGATTLIGDYFEGEPRRRFMGKQASFMGYGGVVFLTLGGVLAEASWRLPFLIYLSGLLVLPLAWKTLWEPHVDHRTPRTEHHDHPGDAAAAEGAGHRVPPVVLYGLALLTFLTFYQVPTQLPFLLETAGLDDARLAGLAVATQPLFGATSALAFAAVKRRASHPLVMAMAFGAMGLAYAVVALSDTLWLVWAAVGLSGIGLGWCMPNINVWILATVPAERRGRAMGGQTTGVFVGQFLAPIAAQPLVTLGGPQMAFAGAAVVLAAAVAGLLWLHRRG